jgi:RNA polymerase sigma factor (sigma-70 family)
VLSFCRHLLGDQQEAEDAVQHTFAAAYRDLLRDVEREIKLKPWLFTIARNRCYSILRARREQPAEEREVQTAGLHEQVEQRAELRDLLHDMAELPVEQRAALVLSELGALSHSEVAEVLGCEVQKVKALVFRARSGLIQRRDGRALDCDHVQEQLANLRGGSLRRSELRHHLRACDGCRAFREQVRSQRSMLAVALPVVPSLKLKSGVLAAAGVGGAGGAGGGTAAGGLGALLGAAGGGATVAKVAILGALTAGGAFAGERALDGSGADRAPAAGQQPAASPPAGGDEARAAASARERAAAASTKAKKANKAKGEAKAKRVRRQGANGRGPADVPGSRGRGAERRSAQAQGVPRGRGPIDAPPAQTPVKRGPVTEPPVPRSTPQLPEAAPLTTPKQAPGPKKTR